MITKDWARRRARYDMLVIGSGYGGAVVAARMATAAVEPRLTICVLERGKEWPAGTFPDSAAEFAAATRTPLNPLGLYETLHYRDISVVKASGLGGCSLVSANVATEPDAEVFTQAGWPRALSQRALAPYYGLARRTLGVGPHPRAGELKKFQALGRGAGHGAEPLDLAVNFDLDGSNAHGVAQKPCTGCGDCMTGCNIGAKNTLTVNYLAMAANAGAEIFTRAEVEWVEKRDGVWLVHGKFRPSPLEEQAFTLEARNVVLSAGSLNTTEILLRSERRGLKVSPRLGSNFSGNGDFFGVVRNSKVEMGSGGVRPGSPDSGEGPGPTITGVIRPDGPKNRFVVEDSTIPSAFAGAAQAALGRNMVLLVMSNDGARGSLVLDAKQPGAVQVQWDNAGRQPVFARIDAGLREMSERMGGRYAGNAVWQALGLRRLITLHPLGGCPMGEDHWEGAVDAFGRVFDGQGGVHEGLFAADGSIVPASLGINPMLTICALAEHIADHKIRQLQGVPYPEPKTASVAAGLDPSHLAGARDEVLDNLFRRHRTLGIEHFLNHGEHRVDLAERRIFNDTCWKGFLPRGLPLNDVSASLFSGYTKRFWKDGDRYVGETRYFDGRVPLGHTIEEITIEERVNDLEPGRYILLRYTDPVFDRLYYDTVKVVNEGVALYRGYTGEFPHGRRGWAAPLLRSYGFDEMSAEDHRLIFAEARPAAEADKEGVWRLDAVANSNHAVGLATVRFAGGPGGMECRFEAESSTGLAGWLEHHFESLGEMGAEDEIRVVDRDLLVGQWTLPLGVAAPASSVGLFHTVTAGGGESRLGFFYLLRRAGAGGGTDVLP